MMRALPKNRLDPKAMIVWRLKGVIHSFVFACIVLTYLILSSIISIIPAPPKWGFLLLIGVIFVYAIYKIAIIPALRYRYWRYEVTEEEIDLYRGIFVRSRTVIPMSRVQHVDTEDGPLFRYYQLASVNISTAATIHVIPVLSTGVADELREKISKFAMVVEEDV